MSRRSIPVAYHIIVLGILALLCGIAVLNAFTFPRVRPGRKTTQGRPVSVLVPARNEETTIERCVTSLLAQEYDSLEVLVLDDDSTDRTGEILREIALRPEGDRLRLPESVPLPQGWTGKNNACARLAAEATGEVLIFVDADTVHEPGMVAGIVAELTERRADLLSSVPRQLVPTFWEQVIVPMAPFLYVCYLPNRLIPRRNHESLVAANGQVIAVERSAYEEIGGHAAVRSAILDDLELARAFKRSGRRVELVRGDLVSSCRMYRSLRDIVEGFSKNLYPGIGGTPGALLLFVAQMILLFVLPWIFLLLAGLSGRGIDDPLFYLPAAQVLLGLIMRGISDRLIGVRPVNPLLQPISALAAAAIALRSWRLHAGGRGGTWKGRRVVEPRGESRQG